MGLQFLLKCHQFHMYPAFISRTINFAHYGHHLERLAMRLPGWMLRATICDMQARLASTQTDLDAVWLLLFDQISDNKHWNALVLHKDISYSHLLAICTKRLQKKFTGLFAHIPNDPYCENGTRPKSPPYGHLLHRPGSNL